MPANDSLKNSVLERTGKDSPSSILYVLNGGANSISAIRSSDDAVISTIEVGGTPICLTPAADGSKVYVGVFNKGAVVIQTTDNMVKTSIRTKSGVWDCPQTIAITPDGSQVYVIDTQPVENTKGTITVIQTSDDAVFATFMIELIPPYDPDSETSTPAGSGTPPKIVFSPDGSKAYITTPTLPRMGVYRTSDNTWMASIVVGEGAQQPVITPNGSKLYVTSEPAMRGKPILSVIDLTKDKIIKGISLAKPPAAMVINPDGSKIYMTSAGVGPKAEPVLLIIDTATDAIVGSVPLPDLPIHLAITPDGSKIYSANPNQGSVSVIQTKDHTILSTIKVGDRPSTFYFSPDGSKIYVTNQNSGTVSVIQTSDQTVVGTIEVGMSPQAIVGIQSPLNSGALG